jgi:hypothetical protein
MVIIKIKEELIKFDELLSYLNSVASADEQMNNGMQVRSSFIPVKLAPLLHSTRTEFNRTLSPVSLEN